MHPLALARKLAARLPQARLRQVSSKSRDPAQHQQDVRREVAEFLGLPWEEAKARALPSTRQRPAAVGNQLDSLAVVDLGGTHVRLGMVDADGVAGATIERKTALLAAGDPVSVLADLLRELTGGDVHGIVVGVPGLLDSAKRVVVDTPNIPQLHGLPLADALAAACGVPVWLDHDAALLTRGEYRAGAGRGGERVLGVYFGTGIGAAFLHHGRPLDAGPFAMQIGHIPVRGSGRRCACGGLDCIEPYASGKRLEELAREYGVPIGEIFTRMPQGELDDFIEAQAIALATPITLFDPDIVVLGGGVLGMAGYPFDRLVAATVRRLSPARPAQRPALVAASLGWAAALHGARALVDAALGGTT
jgi:allose kinase